MERRKIGIVALLTAMIMINTFDRGALGVAAPIMIKDLGIDAGHMGIALSFFYLSYIVCMMPVGWFSDRYGAKRVLGIAAAIWAVMSASTAFVQGFYGLMAARLGVGVGEAAGNPLGAKVIGENFPSEQRATATGFFLSGSKLGMAAVPIVMGFLIAQWNWRIAFLITGLGSLLWCVFWHFGFKETREHAAITTPGKKMVIPWRQLLTSRAIIGLMITKFFLDYLWVFFVSWLPGYLIMERGFSIIKMGIYASIPWVIGFLAQPAVGSFSDWLIQKGVNVSKARKYVLVGSQLVAASVIGVGYVDNPVMAVILLTINIAGESASAGIMWTILAEVSPKGMGGTVPSAVNTVSSFAGILAPTITGFIYQFTGSFQMALFVAGGGVLLSMCAILFIVPEIKPLEFKKITAE
ncbi:MAG: MFS transporter [Veillonellales bacterium]